MSVALPEVRPLGARANQVFQSSWVVTDIEQAMMMWVRTFAVGPFFLFEDVQVDDLRYRGKPARLKFDCAIAQAGPIQIELIAQYGGDASAYRDLYDEGSEGFHHFGMFAPHYDRELHELEGQGYSVATSGRVGAMRYSYVDTSAEFGFMVEILEESADMRTIFAGIASAAENWDGERPIRPVAELLAASR